MRIVEVVEEDVVVMAIIVGMDDVKGVEVVTVVDALVVVVDAVLLVIDVVVVSLGATVVCIRQMSSTTTASIGQHGEPPHCIDNSADNFVQVGAFDAEQFISYL